MSETPTFEFRGEFSFGVVGGKWKDHAKNK